MAFILLIELAIFALMIVSIWKVFEKMGKPGWEGLVPGHNIFEMIKAGGKPGWWIFLCMIPFAGVIWVIWSLNMFLKKFGKSTGFTVGMVLLAVVFLPILAFDDSTFDGSAEDKNPDILDSNL